MNEDLAQAVQSATNKQLLQMLVKQVDGVQETQEADGRCLASLATEVTVIKKAVELSFDNAVKIEKLEERVSWHQYIIGGTFLAALISVFRQQIELLLDKITQHIVI